MIKHVVMFRLKEDSTEQASELILKLKALKSQIKEIKMLEVGRNFAKSERAMDVLLITLFESKDDLATYQVHPNHLPVVEFVKEICNETKVVDYEIE